MGLLEALLGAGQGPEDNRGFLERFEQGPPWEGYSDQEVLSRYGTVAGQASPQHVRIFAANRDVLADPDRIRPGQRLRIP